MCVCVTRAGSKGVFDIGKSIDGRKEENSPLCAWVNLKIETREKEREDTEQAKYCALS